MNEAEFFLNYDSKDAKDRELVASQPNCPLSILEKLARDRNSDVLKAVATNPNCSENVLLTLLMHTFPITKKMLHLEEIIVKHPNCTPEVLSRLLNKDNLYVQILEHKNCTDLIQEQIIDCIYNNPKKAISNNKMLYELLKTKQFSRESFEKLATISHRDVLHAMSVNKHFPKDLLTTLIKYSTFYSCSFIDGCDNHIIEIAQNPDTPTEVLMEILKEYHSRNYVSITLEVLKNPNLPILELYKFYDARLFYEELIRKCIAKNPSCPIDLLTKLAHNGDEATRMAVAENCNISLDLFKILSKDKNAKVRASIIKNKKCPKKLIIYLYKTDKSNLVVNVAKQIMNERDIVVSESINTIANSIRINIDDLCKIINETKNLYTEIDCLEFSISSPCVNCKLSNCIGTSSCKSLEFYDKYYKETGIKKENKLSIYPKSNENDIFGRDKIIEIIPNVIDMNTVYKYVFCIDDFSNTLSFSTMVKTSEQLILALNQTIEMIKNTSANIYIDDILYIIDNI